MTFLKISITQKGSIHFTNKYWTDLASSHAQIFYGNWRWQGGGWVLGVWICMIRDAWFWFFTISYCILCCRNRLMVFINSLEESRPRAGLVMTWSRQKGPTLLWLISKCVFANIGDYSPGTESQSRHSNGISGLYLVLMETSDNTEVFTDFSQSLESGFSP